MIFNLVGVKISNEYSAIKKFPREFRIEFSFFRRSFKNIYDSYLLQLA